ncbi:MAG: nitric oxide reductase activation protein, partial [Mycobacterium sp.]
MVNEDTTSDTGDGPQRLRLLASALAGRNLAVAPADPGEPAWTDGVTVFIDAAASAGHQVESVTVQASLLAGGGLEPDVVRKLVRR